MICLLSLVVFGVMGVFSATHRRLANEAFDCVFRRVTFRKCRTGFDKKMKSLLTGKVLGFSPKAGKFVYKNFEVLSWTFTIVLVGSLVFSGLGMYNLVSYGSCDPHSTTCIFNPGELTCGSEDCEERGCDCEEVGCEGPEFEACKGNCSCQETVCG